MTRQQRLDALHREWFGVLVVNLLLLMGAYWLLADAWDGSAQLNWAGLSGLLLVYQLVHLRRNLEKNHPADAPEKIYSTLGLGNWITILRSSFLALLSGFLAAPRPEGWAAWAPGSLYMAAVILDFLDGWAARAMRHTSLLGEILDLHWDGYGALVASILLVIYGQAPIYYVLVGLARYLFLFGLWLRERQGLVNHDMQPSVMRRALAGAQMGFIAVILLPVFSPPATLVAATIFMLPLMWSFMRDWLVVSGVIGIKERQKSEKDWRQVGLVWLRTWLPLILRTATILLLVAVLIEEARSPAVLLGVLLVGSAGLVLIAAGAAGRVAALGVMLMCGFVLRDGAQNGLYWAILLAGTGVLLAGDRKVLIMETGRVADLSSRRGSQPTELMQKRQVRWVWLIWLALPALIFWALSSIPLGDVWQALTGLQAWQIAALGILNLAVLGLISGRWWVILRSFGFRVDFLKLFGYRLAGFGVSYYTPGPQLGGEALQVLLLQNKQDVPSTTGVASVFFDKLLELLASFTFLVIGVSAILMAGLLDGVVSAQFILLIPAVLVWPALHLHALAVGKRPLTGLLGHAAHRWSWRGWGIALRHAAEGEKMIGRLMREKPITMAGLLLISLLVWMASIAEFTLMLRFLGAPVSLVQSIAILTAARLAFLLPIPGGLGVVEASLFLALQAAGFDPAIGLAASMIIRARDMTLGAIGLWIGGWNFRRGSAWVERRSEAWNE